MSIPQPKFSIGDAVWVARAYSDQKMVKCPDCLGSGLWDARLPNGETFGIHCPTCTYGYDHGTGFVRDYEFSDRSFQGTVGSVQIDTNARSGETIRYMLHETGVGSGSIYYEPNLFADESDARAHAAELVVKNAASSLDQAKEEYQRRRRDRPGGFAAYARSEIRRLEKETARWRDSLAREVKSAHQPLTASAGEDESK